MNKLATLALACLLAPATEAFANDYKSGPEEKDMTAYLFTYFTSGTPEQGEAIRFAVSLDGYNYKALNGNKPVIDSKQISQTGGVRDPHILRGEDGKTFYMVVTDMVAANGWDSNRAMVLLKSTDLVDWKASVVNIQQKFKGQEDLKRVWAPQTIYDPQARKYMVYWSMKHGDGPDIIYYAYANDDFTDIEGEPRVLFLPSDGKACIDGDIIPKNGLFHIFYKTEGHGNGIRRAITHDLTSGKWIEQPGYKQQTEMAVEGSCVFKLANQNKYILMYDVYRNKEFHFCESCDLDQFKKIDEAVTLDFKPRHGTAMAITRRELDRLLDRWGEPEGFNRITDRNPIIEGYYADPEILYSQKEKKYFLYPTSDGYNAWSGHYFKTFSSTDLKEWQDEGVILDLKKDVNWANGNAWAPAIIEKKIKNKYRYFFYYSGGMNNGQKMIGVATADHPAGPFTDSGKALIDFRPEGLERGQQIDPDVFTDPKTGKSYLFWGCAYLAGAELGKDMISIKQHTMQVMTPDDSFREGVYVFYRNGLYYFLWSQDDTRSPNYKIRYAYADSPLGKLTIPENNIVMEKDASRDIHATGHNSVLQVPDSDDFYLVYHRFGRPEGIRMGRAAGYHREVCMDKLEFNADGTIRQVTPSL